MKHWLLLNSWCTAAGLAVLFGLGATYSALAQEAESKGENFSAKPPAQLFQSDCTGAGCHKGPQGLAKAHGIGLAGFLREHYTTSRESAAALAAYLSKLPGGPEPKEARTPRSGKLPPAGAAANGPGWFEPASGEAESAKKQAPNESRTARHPNARNARTAAHHDEPAAPANRDAEGGDASAKQNGEPPAKPAARERGHNRRSVPAAATAAASRALPETAASPEPSPAPAAAETPASPPPAAAPAPGTAPAAAAPTTATKKYDIFD